MEQAKSNPLGYEKIGALIRKFSVPSIISMLVNAIYNLVDQIFISQVLGVVGTAATNVAFPLTTISTAIALLFGVGGASNFNLKLGAGQPEESSKTAGTALSISGIFGVGLAAITLLFLNPMLYFFGATESIMPYATPYTAIVAVGLPFMIFSTTATNMIRADGSPRFAMGCMLAGAVFNLVFDPIFLFVFNMGIEGIALATTLGQILSAAIAFVYLRRRFSSVPLKREHIRPRARYIGIISKLGAAACFNQLAMTVVQIALNNVLRHYGELSVYGSEIPLAVVGALSKVNVLFLAFIIGVAQGCQPINSFNYGAGNYARVRKTVTTALLLASAMAVVAFLIFQLFPRTIASIFGKGDELFYTFAVKYLRIYMAGTFLNGIQPVVANFFTSIGKATRGIFISLTRQVILLLPLVILLPTFFGIDGVVYAGPIADVCAAVLAASFLAVELKRLKNLERQTGGPQPE